MRRALFLVLVVVGCSPADSLPLDIKDEPADSADSNDRPAAPPPYQKANLYVFSDRSDPYLERSYAFLGESAAAQVCVFPGYTNRKMYACSSLPQEILVEMQQWAARQATQKRTHTLKDTKFSFRTIILAGQTDRSSTDFFENSDPELKAFFARLEKHVLDEKNRVEQLPEFIMLNPEARLFFGFFDDAR